MARQPRSRGRPSELLSVGRAGSRREGDALLLS